MKAAADGRSLSCAALSNVTGQCDAERLLLALRDGLAPSDLLLEALQQVQAHGDPERMQGWVRRLQKQLEQAA